MRPYADCDNPTVSRMDQLLIDLIKLLNVYIGIKCIQ